MALCMPFVIPIIFIATILFYFIYFVDATIRFFLGPFVSETSPDAARFSHRYSGARAAVPAIKTSRISRRSPCVVGDSSFLSNNDKYVPASIGGPSDAVKVHASISSPIAPILSWLYSRRDKTNKRSRVRLSRDIFLTKNFEA